MKKGFKTMTPVAENNAEKATSQGQAEAKMAKGRAARIATRRKSREKAQQLANAARHEGRVLLHVESPEGPQTISVEVGHDYPHVSPEAFIHSRREGKMSDLRENLETLNE